MDPLPIPVERLPCDRLSPPESFAETARAPLDALLAALSRARERTDADLGDLPVESLARPSLWGTVRVETRERVHQIAAHLVEVIAQAEKMLGARETEARRITRRIAYIRGLHERTTDPARLTELDARLEAIGAAGRGRG